MTRVDPEVFRFELVDRLFAAGTDAATDLLYESPLNGLIRKGK